MAHKVYAALLRGINVGGNNKVSMAELKACFAQLGYKNVTTYINSGNVIFTASGTTERALENIIEPALEKAFGFPLTVVVCGLSQLHDIVAAMPKNWVDQSDKRCNVIFLRHTIDSPNIVKQLPAKPDIEVVAYCAGALLWSTRIDAITRSGLHKILGLPVYKDMTIRNQNTTRKIYALMQATAPAV